MTDSSPPSASVKSVAAVRPARITQTRLHAASLRLLQLAVVLTLIAFLSFNGSRHFAANTASKWLAISPSLWASVSWAEPEPSFSLATLPAGQVDPLLTEQLSQLRQRYPAFIEPYIFVFNTQTQRMASLRGDEPVPAASVIKLPILASLYSRIAQGDIDPQKVEWQFQDIHRAEGSGDLQYQKVGQWLSVQQLAEKMIQISDNTATNIIVDNLGGMETLNQDWKSWQLAETRLNNWLPDLRGTNLITMQDMARLLYNVNQPDGWLPVPYKQAIKTILLGTKNRRLLVSGVPAGTSVAHKTGDIGTVVGDVGIVRIQDQDVIVCVMARRPRNHPMGRQLVQDVMKTVYNHTVQTALAEATH